MSVAPTLTQIVDLLGKPSSDPSFRQLCGLCDQPKVHTNGYFIFTSTKLGLVFWTRADVFRGVILTIEPAVSAGLFENAGTDLIQGIKYADSRSEVKQKLARKPTRSEMLDGCATDYYEIDGLRIGFMFAESGSSVLNLVVEDFRP